MDNYANPWQVRAVSIPANMHELYKRMSDSDTAARVLQAALSSMICFSLGAAVPLLSAAFITDPKIRLVSVILASTVALAIFGAVGKPPRPLLYAELDQRHKTGMRRRFPCYLPGAWLGGAQRFRAALRVLIGGWMAFAVTYGVCQSIPEHSRDSVPFRKLFRHAKKQIDWHAGGEALWHRCRIINMPYAVKGSKCQCIRDTDTEAVCYSVLASVSASYPWQPIGALYL